MNTNQIRLNETVYEVQRVYSGNATVADIIKNRLASSDSQIPPLTVGGTSVYNNSELRVPKEVK